MLYFQSHEKNLFIPTYLPSGKRSQTYMLINDTLVFYKHLN